ncbi:hypothetical protein ABZZ74_47925 [Streptomyces sp. NPDC006476]|uniref:hypothetical protein n=1 Tax=Streptomyces sp. NPDC006476 TaxID=3157175 RepID=UPI0033BD167A
MAQVVGLTSDQLRQAGRSDAADVLDELAGPPFPASTAGTPDTTAQIEAITALLATLSPEAREQVLSRFDRPAVGESGQTDVVNNTGRREAS